MDLIPYPPDWSRAHSLEIEQYWRRFSRQTAVRGYVVAIGDEDQPWRFVAFAGFFALFLVTLLFLETGRVNRKVIPLKKTERVVAQPVKLVSVPVEPAGLDTRIQLAPRVVENSYKVEVQPVSYEVPVVQEPEPFEDPFAVFAPKPDQPPHPVFEPPSVPVAPTPFMSPAHLELAVENTDLIPDFAYSEQAVRQTEFSHYTAPLSHLFAETHWHVPSSFESPFVFNQPASGRWLDQTRLPNVIVSSELTSAETSPANARDNSSVHPDLQVTKLVPATSAGDEVRYEIEVTNKGVETLPEVILREQGVNLEELTGVTPTPQVSGRDLCWVIRQLHPGETKRFEVRSLTPSAAFLQTETSVEVAETLATVSRIEVPDVIVFVTVPVEVGPEESFEALIKIQNDSQKQFGPSDLEIQFGEGIRYQERKSLVKRIDVPLPGKSIEFPLALRSTANGQGVIEANLLLENAIVVPVRANLAILTPADEATEKTKSIARRPPQELVSFTSPWKRKSP